VNISPKISIITVTFNAEEVLERTVQSIVSQTFTDYEYLIIDGKSTDKTLQIAEKYRDKIDCLISEPDKGLYDAMNKGLQAAKGEYVWFMNAGDTIFEQDTLQNVFAQSQNADIYYGNALFVKEDGSAVGLRDKITPHRLPQKLTWQSMRFGMVVCHQAFIVRRRLAPLYDTKNLSADLDWEILCLRAAKEIVFTQQTLCRYLTGGISEKKRIASLKDRFRVIQKHFGFFGAILSHIFIAFRGLFFYLKPENQP
jgi:glycosyltransferase involved in cell wall biosynthesis